MKWDPKCQVRDKYYSYSRKGTGTEIKKGTRNKPALQKAGFKKKSHFLPSSQLLSFYFKHRFKLPKLSLLVFHQIKKTCIHHCLPFSSSIYSKKGLKSSCSTQYPSFRTQWLASCRQDRDTKDTAPNHFEELCCKKTLPLKALYQNHLLTLRNPSLLQSWRWYH